MKKRYLIPLVVIAALAVIALALRTPDTDAAAMQAKYGGDDARYAEGPGGLSIHYRDAGNRSGPAIIFVHGTSSSLHTWGPLAERLGATYRIIAYDQPGHGLTGPSAGHDYSAASMMAALDAVAAAAGVETFTLAGNSMGGWVAWRYALENPGRIEALILLDAAGAPLRAGEEPPPLNIGFRLIRSPVGRFLLQHYTPRALVERSLLETISVETIVDGAYVDRHWELLRYPGNRAAAAARAGVDREPALFARVGEIAAPTLILWGAEDQLIRASAAETFAEALPNETVVLLDGVGHIPMEEAPDATATAIEGFLADLPLSSPGQLGEGLIEQHTAEPVRERVQ